MEDGEGRLGKIEKKEDTKGKGVEYKRENGKEVQKKRRGGGWKTREN